MAKSRRTFQKSQREYEKKRKAEEKREDRQLKKLPTSDRPASAAERTETADIL